MCSKSKAKPAAAAAATKSEGKKTAGAAAAALFSDDDDNEDADLFVGHKAAEPAKKETKVRMVVATVYTWRNCSSMSVCIILLCVLDKS